MRTVVNIRPYITWSRPKLYQQLLFRTNNHNAVRALKSDLLFNISLATNTNTLNFEVMVWHLLFYCLKATIIISHNLALLNSISVVSLYSEINIIDLII